MPTVAWPLQSKRDDRPRLPWLLYIVGGNAGVLFSDVLHHHRLVHLVEALHVAAMRTILDGNKHGVRTCVVAGVLVGGFQVAEQDTPDLVDVVEAGFGTQGEYVGVQCLCRPRTRSTDNCYSRGRTSPTAPAPA